MITAPPTHALDARAYGEPFGEPRGRAVLRAGHAAVRSSDRADPWKRTARSAVVDALLALHGQGRIPWPVFPLGQPVAVHLRFYMPRPLDHYVASDPRRPLKPGRALLWPTAVPDVDNLAKAVLDALGPWPKGQMPVLWKTDAQVVELQAVKLYTTSTELPGMRLLAWPL